MKRFYNYIFLVFSFGLSIPALSQIVKPGDIVTASSSYKSSSSVDYTTGIMNYNIPLLSLSQDGYDVPISLNYNAAGIKLKTKKAGLVGLGWSLSYGGGTISRTLRGGFADEDISFGILFNPAPASGPSLDIWTKKIAEGELDGESDIFTVNIKGGVFKFVLKIESGQPIVYPLERTDVKIDCIYDQGISGFRITDAQGLVYTFESTNSANAYTRTPFAGNTNVISSVLSWYLTKVSVPDNGDIIFEYESSCYLENTRDFTSLYIQYGKPLVAPSLDDPNLESALNAYINSNNQVAEMAEHIKENVRTLNSIQDLPPGSIIDNPVQKEINQEQRQRYIEQINSDFKLFKDKQFENNYNISIVQPILYNMYYTNKETNFEFKAQSQYNLFPNKLIRKITTRTGVIEFSYIGAILNYDAYYDYDYQISKINYRSSAGDLLKSVEFSVDNKGFLKRAQSFTNDGHVENRYDFDYYNEADTLNQYAIDYWGYYNGKANNNPFPESPAYMFATEYGYSTVFSSAGVGEINGNYINVQNQADKRPVGSAAMARSLKKISNLLGGSVSFEYEGNTVYTIDGHNDLPVGGIRIKGITVNDGQNTLTTTYKYKFPLLSNPSISRSTGRLTEWREKSFVHLYRYTHLSSTYTDINFYSDLVNMGSIYDDNSNNGVLYHYVEEVRSDNSATGYKYPEVFSTGVTLPHRPILDKVLLAKIEYNSAGKIVNINRHKYLTNLTDAGNRLPEFTMLEEKYKYLETGSINSSIVFLPQLKKRIIFYKEDVLKSLYPDKETAITRFNGYTYSINPYYRIYMENYAPRVHPIPDEIKSYFVYAGNAILPKTDEISIFNADYDVNIGHASSNTPYLPDEKAYLYERLLNAPGIKPVQTIVDYQYTNDTHLLPTHIRTTNSDGVISLEKFKYAADYQLGTGDPVTALTARGQKLAVIEKQLWKSMDGGISFKLVSGKINEYVARTVSGKKYILPENEYVLNVSAPLVSPSITNGQTPASNPPYANIFWDNKSLYGNVYNTRIWEVYNLFSRQVSYKDRGGNILNTVKYDRFSGDPVLKTQSVDPRNIAVFDYSPYQKHDYYNKYHLFLNRRTDLYKTRFSFKDYPVSLNKIDGYVTIDHKFYASGIDSALNDFEVGNVITAQKLNNIPTYFHMRRLIRNIRDSNDINEFLTAYSDYRHALNSMVYSQSIDMQLLFYDTADGNEIRQYISIFASYFAWNSEAYENTIIDAPNILPMVKVVSRLPFIPLSVDVDNLIASNVNLDIYFTNVYNEIFSPDFNVKYRVKYADNSFSSLNNIALSAINSKLWKSKLVLGALANSASIKSIEFNIDDFKSMGMFAAIPENSLFSATSYLPSHTPYLSFNQSGRYSETFYDHFLNRHFIKDFKNNIVQTDTVSYAVQANPSATTMVPVWIYNKYDRFVSTPNIVRVELFNTSTLTRIIKDVKVIAGHFSRFEIPEGNYEILVKTDEPAGKMTYGNNVTAMPAREGLFYDTISGSSIYYITIKNPNDEY